MADELKRLQTALADRYRIEREIGSGGMATVYLAEDLKHHHSVAIKVLRPELTAVLGPERFLREIEITRRLTHPFILPILDSGSAGEFLYYVMPYVKGESLRDRLKGEKQLALEDALQISREVADALDYAHRQGVVHRDIKPENILLEEQHAVVADFGIARAIDVVAGERLTETGVVIGTPEYMSPEQGAGSRDLDGRSDVYSLGCVLYEMLAGQVPFSGPTAQAVQARHAFDPVPPLGSVRPGLSAEIEGVVTKALAKASADRFATAAKFNHALVGSSPPTRETPPGTQVDAQPLPPRKRFRRVAVAMLGAAVIVLGAWAWLNRPSATPAQPAKKAWILVAEFEGPADDSSLAAATRDLVSAALDQSQIVATVPDDQIRLGLELMERPPDTPLNPVLARELAERHSVRTVVEGRIGRIGKGYSITLQVMDVDSSKAVVTVSGTAKNDDDLIPTVERVSRQLRRGLGENWMALQATRPLVQEMTASLEAFRLSRRAVLLNDREGDARGAIAVARQALAIDPSYAEAWKALSVYWFNLGRYDSSQVALERAHAMPERLSSLSLGLVEADVARSNGDLDAALNIYTRLAKEHGMDGLVYGNLGFALFESGRFEEALASYRREAEAAPFGPIPASYWMQYVCLITIQRLEEARAVAEKLEGAFAAVAAVHLALAAGDWERADSLGNALARDLTVAARWRQQGHTAVAAAHAVRGEFHSANDALSRALSIEGLGAKASVMIAELLLSRLSGRPLRTPTMESSSTFEEFVGAGLWAVIRGDTGRARDLLRNARARPVWERVSTPGPATVLEGFIAVSGGRWDDAVAILRPVALQGAEDGFAMHPSARVAARWLMGEGFEQLSRPDSAVAYYEQSLAPYGLWPETRVTLCTVSSFAHQRLVLLYARMGRLEDARRHYDILRAAFTHPDPELRYLIDEARAALETAEAMAHPG